ncbi:MAG: D-2-hydroxyacid dehydrogenase [Clostridia bacterium]|nr:D-2-hydroxyacid dehydrogenase [Clostridia bacterium]
MNIVILDSVTANPGDLSWDFLEKYGKLTVYDRSPVDLIYERAKDADIVILNKTPMSRQTIEKLPRLKMIALLATGYNIIDCDAADEYGVNVVNIPSYSASAVAQQTFAFILEYANRIGLHSDSVLSGEWAKYPDFCYQLAPLRELLDKTIGIIGFGKIGRRVAEIAKAFEMKVLIHTAHPEKYKDENYNFVDRDTLLANSDFVTIHCPLTPETEKMVNVEFISKMKDGAFLVNTSRGGELDEAAVKAALDSGKLSGAGVDVLSVEPPVPENPLFHTKNIYITPHIAWASYDTRVRLMHILEENISAFCSGNPINVVNSPRV